jgi:hypothetical protein
MFVVLATCWDRTKGLHLENYLHQHSRPLGDVHYGLRLG